MVKMFSSLMPTRHISTHLMNTENNPWQLSSWFSYLSLYRSSTPPPPSSVKHHGMRERARGRERRRDMITKPEMSSSSEPKRCCCPTWLWFSGAVFSVKQQVAAAHWSTTWEGAPTHTSPLHHTHAVTCLQHMRFCIQVYACMRLVVLHVNSDDTAAHSEPRLNN